MSERPPSDGEVGRQPELRKFSELPHYYQCLGRACAAAGVLAEFYWVLEMGFDYGQAARALRQDLERSDKVDDVDDFLLMHGIPSEYDEE